MRWIKRGENLEATTNNLPISFWVGHCNRGFNANVYCGGKLVFNSPAFDQDQGKAICEEWLERFIQQLQILRSES